MIFLKKTLAVVVAGCLLVACQKDAPKTEAVNADDSASAEVSAKPAEVQASTEQPAKDTAVITGTLPPAYQQYLLASYQLIVISEIDRAYEAKHGKPVASEAVNCLLETAGHANYLAVLEPHAKKVLSAEELTQAEAFFSSSAGQKFSQTLLSQMGAGLPATEPLTAEEQAVIAESIEAPFLVKMEEALANMSEEESSEFLIDMMAPEMTRCQLA
ncbi:MAG: hypothetical protein Q4B88_04980 [Moraxella sp.]|nr:hypothetical protein [Moraxella sp.]